MNAFLTKYGSRKFLVALLTDVVAIATASGLESDYAKIIMFFGALVINIVYIVAEKAIDKARIEKVLTAVADTIDDIADEVESEKGKEVV